VASFYLAITHLSLGDIGRAEALLRANVARGGDGATPLPFNLPPLGAVQSRSQLSRCLALRGALDEAAAMGQEALDLAERLGRPFDIAYACQAFGGALVARGAPDRAVAPLERAVELCRAWGFGLILGGAVINLGRAFILLGRTDRGLALLESAVDLRSDRANTLQLVQAGDAYLAAGRRDEAMTAAERGLAFARVRKERPHEAWALRLLGDVLARDALARETPSGAAPGGGAADGGGPSDGGSGRPSDGRVGGPSDADPGAVAEASYRQALALGEEIGLRPLVARCHAGLGRLLARSDRRAEAAEHRATAVALLAEMGMTDAEVR
jgi:tetratricopeptide (TPR) repeat protein